MQTLTLQKSTKSARGKLTICGSKSESNRALILNQLFDQTIQIENLSDAQDTVLLQKAFNSTDSIIDVHHAGTAMRFLTAYFSIQKDREVVLTGSERMKERPIGILVDALRQLGAEINYLEKENFPPLQIKGQSITQNQIQLQANISSQYITALMLIGAKLVNGLKIQLIGKVTSLPYITMTVTMMRKLGIDVEFKQNIISVKYHKSLNPQIFKVESDWSSVSYFYAIAALSDEPKLELSSFFENSLQGDSKLVEIYRIYFGVRTEFIDNQIILTKDKKFIPKPFVLDLNQTPDLAQTIAVTCAGLKVKCKLTGLETLKIKETDRLIALQKELSKVGAITEITNASLEIIGFTSPESMPCIETYNDHRMAMAFAVLYQKMDLEILDPLVVVKSYPRFWDDLKMI